MRSGTATETEVKSTGDSPCGRAGVAGSAPGAAATFQTGVVSRVGKAGYGFIVPDDEGPDVFFHVKECFLRNTYLRAGDRVAFEINQFARGEGRRACEVRRLT
jgi:cold shock CspA family protein